MEVEWDGESVSVLDEEANELECGRNTSMVPDSIYMPSSRSEWKKCVVYSSKDHREFRMYMEQGEGEPGDILINKPDRFILSARILDHDGVYFSVSEDLHGLGEGGSCPASREGSVASDSRQGRLGKSKGMGGKFVHGLGGFSSPGDSKASSVASAAELQLQNFKELSIAKLERQRDNSFLLCLSTCRYCDYEHGKFCCEVGSTEREVGLRVKHSVKKSKFTGATEIKCLFVALPSFVKVARRRTSGSSQATRSSAGGRGRVGNLGLHNDDGGSSPRGSEASVFSVDSELDSNCVRARTGTVASHGSMFGLQRSDSQDSATTILRRVVWCPRTMRKTFARMSVSHAVSVDSESHESTRSNAPKSMNDYIVLLSTTSSSASDGKKKSAGVSKKSVDSMSVACVKCSNKVPDWNPKLHSLVSRFYENRITCASAHNFIMYEDSKLSSFRSALKTDDAARPMSPSSSAQAPSSAVSPTAAPREGAKRRGSFSERIQAPIKSILGMGSQEAMPVDPLQAQMGSEDESSFSKRIPRLSLSSIMGSTGAASSTSPRLDPPSGDKGAGRKAKVSGTSSVLKPETAIMQFGCRVDSAEEYVLDYRFPLSPLQAFAIALSSFAEDSVDNYIALSRAKNTPQKCPADVNSVPTASSPSARQGGSRLVATSDPGTTRSLQPTQQLATRPSQSSSLSKESSLLSPSHGKIAAPDSGRRGFRSQGKGAISSLFSFLGFTGNNGESDEGTMSPRSQPSDDETGHRRDRDEGSFRSYRSNRTENTEESRSESFAPTIPIRSNIPPPMLTSWEPNAAFPPAAIEAPPSPYPVKSNFSRGASAGHSPSPPTRPATLSVVTDADEEKSPGAFDALRSGTAASRSKEIMPFSPNDPDRLLDGNVRSTSTKQVVSGERGMLTSAALQAHAVSTGSVASAISTSSGGARSTAGSADDGASVTSGTSTFRSRLINANTDACNSARYPARKRFFSADREAVTALSTPIKSSSAKGFDRKKTLEPETDAKSPTALSTPIKNTSATFSKKLVDLPQSSVVHSELPSEITNLSEHGDFGLEGEERGANQLTPSVRILQSASSLSSPNPTGGFTRPNTNRSAPHTPKIFQKPLDPSSSSSK